MLCSQKKAVNQLFIVVVRKISLLFILFTYSASSVAHVKWFVEDDSQYRNFYYPVDALSVSIIAITLLFFLFISLLDRKAKFSLRLNRLIYGAPIPQLINNPGDWANALLKQSIAIAFLANLLQGHFVAPNFVPNGDEYIYIVLQALLILILILNVNLFSVSLILFSLYLLISFPLESSIDYVPELLALGFALFFTDSSRRRNRYSFRVAGVDYSISSWDLGLALLRTGLGMQLIILTFHDKLLNPGFGLAFLAEYPYFNFPHYWGFEGFTDLHFLLCAGMVELSLGILLVTNIVPRLALVFIVFIFLLTGFILGLGELAGHIPIIVTAVVLIFGLSQKAVFLLDKKQTELVAE